MRSEVAIPKRMQTEKQPTEKRKINYPRKIARIFLKIILFLFLFIILIFLLVLTPPVQRFLTSKVENYLENKIKTKVEIGRIAFGLSGKVSLTDVYFEDRNKDTLLSGETIRAQINFMKLFSNEVEVKDIELQNITAKIKRVLPDTVFNFQYIVDAFVTQSAAPDTAAAAPMKMDISDITLENVRLQLNDAVTGNDMNVQIGNLAATIDSLDFTAQHYGIHTLIVRNTRARIRQTKPLVTPEPAAKDMAEAAAPSPMQLGIGTVEFSNVDVDYGNDVSAFYTAIDLGRLKVDAKLIDFQNQRIYLDELTLDRSVSLIRLGNKPAAEVVAKEIEQEVAAQAQKGWDFRVDKIRIDNNVFQFDNDNTPAQAYGMDFAHMRADSFSLFVDNFIFKPDSIYANITEGRFKEKSGFRLNELRGGLLYASNQAYLKDLYIRTPGTELKRNLMLEYASLDALTTNFPATLLNIEIDNSTVQVKDILAFAPQLRTHPAFANPNDIWHLHIVGSGNIMDRLNFESLRFDGLSNTQLDAEGVLASITDPNQAGGTFTIHRLHTTQTDLSLFTGGQRLSNAQMNLPESFDINGTINGNASRLTTNLNVNTSMGFAAVNGTFGNLTVPDAATYNATVRTSGLRIGSIIRQPDVGSLSARFTMRGRGLTPNTMNTVFSGYINSFGYNNYAYRNIALNGSLRGTLFDVTVDSKDPNAYLNLAVNGNLTDQPSFRVNGFIDSLKTMPLNFTTQPMVFRGKIEGDIPSINPDNLEADVMITNALLVSGTDRLPLDTVHLVSGSTGSENFLRLTSDIASAEMTGQYRLSDMGFIIQNTIQPYFSVAPYVPVKNIQPYDFTFRADLVYSPVFASFMPGFTAAETIHAEGRMATDSGLNALVSAPYLEMNGNQIEDLDLTVRTGDSGMVINGTVAHLMSGNSMDIYNVQVNAVALNNNINFSLGVDDKNGNDKYRLAGLFTQPSPGDLRIQLSSDTLLLNYDPWTVTPGNSISIIDNQIIANNFQLQRGQQQLSLQSGTGSNPPLDVRFSNFQIGTVTGFLKSDSVLIDGTTNGTVTLRNLMTVPVFTSDLTITNLSMRQDTVGNVALQVSSNGGSYNTNMTLTGRGNDVALTGSFTPGAKDVALDLDLAIRRLDMNNLEGAMKTFVKSASGSINGTVAINGTTSDPDLNGRINFDSTTITTIMLGGPLTITDETLNVSNEGFVFDNFTILDSARNELNIDGEVATSNFINYDFDLWVEARNFRALNTTKQDNDIYYGQLYLTTDLHIAGNEKEPVMDGSVRVIDGTNLSIVIPQAEPGVVQREGIVEFVDFDSPENDSLFLAYDSLNQAGIMGFDIAANIQVDKEAIFNIIVDAASGDFVNLQGEATLSAGIDPSGKITLTGPYEIEQGSYQFSFNFLQRRFTMQKGSRIVWMGEPTNAQLDATAIYEANIAPLDLVANQLDEAQRNFYLQKLPFQIMLNLDGEMLKPVITFDIQLPEERNYSVGGDVETNVRNRLGQLRQEPSELNKQVFAVLLLNRFVGENPFQSAGGGGGLDAGTFARQSVSKLLTEQLNDLAAGLIEGVDINFDVGSTDDYSTGQRRTQTNLNVGLSKRLLNDRLTITVGSNFMLEGAQQTQQRSSNIAENISVNYQLSRDGRYMLRFYRRNEYEGMVDGYVIESGLGFSISVDYNRFRQIFQARRIKRDQRKAEKEQKKAQEEKGKADNQNTQTNEGTKAP